MLSTKNRFVNLGLRASLLAFFMTATACGTIRLKYQGAVKSGQEDQVVIVEKSYPVKGAFKPLCIISGIFLGGSCWYYLVMPTVPEKKEFREDAHRLISKKLGLPPERISNEKISRVSWDQAETIVVVRPIED